MVHYFKADIKRCVKRIPRIAALAIAFILIFINLNKGFNGSEYHSWAKVYSKVPDYLTLFFGIIEIYFVFDEDMRNRIVQTVIGRGINRERIVFVKYFEFAVLTLVDYFFYTVLYKVMSLFGRTCIPAEYEAEYMLRVFFSWILMMEITAICMILIFKQSNIIFTILIYLILVTGLLGKASTLIAGLDSKYYKLHLEKLDIVSINNKAFALAALGNPRLEYIAAMFMYLVAGTCLTAALFSREELEF